MLQTAHNMCRQFQAVSQAEAILRCWPFEQSEFVPSSENPSRAPPHAGSAWLKPPATMHAPIGYLAPSDLQAGFSRPGLHRHSPYTSGRPHGTLPPAVAVPSGLLGLGQLAA
eukprot:10282538-Alexandrium_andersonii.AAC.1